MLFESGRVNPYRSSPVRGIKESFLSDSDREESL
jgi:hypothetical protein